MFEKVATAVPLADLAPDHINHSIEKDVNIVRKNEPDARMVEAALVELLMPVSIKDPRVTVRQIVVSYLWRMENIRYDSFKDDSPKKTVVHLTEVPYPGHFEQIVVKDLKYRQILKNIVKSFSHTVYKRASGACEQKHRHGQK